MRRLIYLLLFGLLLFGAVAFAQIPPGSQTADEATARAAWLKVDAFEPEALRAFLSEFPESGYVKDAKALLVMHQRIADYRSRKAKPQFIISTKQLGARWTDSKAASERDIVGFAFVKTDFEPGVGLAGTLPLFKGTGTVRYTEMALSSRSRRMG